MKLIFAQGNTGPEYTPTRHNVGFLALDLLREQLDGTDFAQKAKFHAHISQVDQGGEKAILTKPTTFYNETGRSARAIADFYNIPLENTLVLHDDLSLPFGTLRTRLGGSGGGNKGIRSLNQHLGDDYYRLRIGIHNDLADRIDAADFVLSRFTTAESQALQKDVLPKTIDIIEQFLADKLDISSYSAAS